MYKKVVAIVLICLSLFSVEIGAMELAQKCYEMWNKLPEEDREAYVIATVVVPTSFCLALLAVMEPALTSLAEGKILELVNIEALQAEIVDGLMND